MTISNFTLKPVFIGWATFLLQLPIQILFSIWCGGFIGGILSDAIGNKHPGFSIFIICGSIPFIVIPLIAYFGKKLNYANTDYKFYDDRVEFTEGFISINEKIIYLKDIREVSLRKGVIQRMYGLGSIYLATLATGTSTGAYNNPFLALGFGNVSASGIIIRDIKEPDENYSKISELVKARRGSGE